MRTCIFFCSLKVCVKLKLFAGCLLALTGELPEPGASSVGDLLTDLIYAVWVTLIRWDLGETARSP